MEIRPDDPTARYVADLLAHHLEELRGVMAEHAFALDAAGLSAAAVTFWTAWQGDALLGFGALKQLDDTHGEVKSMRAAPDAPALGALFCTTSSLKPVNEGMRASAWRRVPQRCTLQRSRSTAAPVSHLVRHSPTIGRARTTSS